MELTRHPLIIKASGGVRCHIIRGEGFVNSCISPICIIRSLITAGLFYLSRQVSSTYYLWMPPKCRQSLLQRVERVCGVEFLSQPKPFDLHLPRATQRRWWTEREKHNEDGGRTRQAGSFEPKKNRFRTTPGLKGRRNR